jgi:hypothetical protein
MFGLSLIPLFASFVLATPSSAPSPEPSPYYVQFCSGAQSDTDAQVEARNTAQRKGLPVQEADAMIIDSATRAIQSSKLPSMKSLKSISIAVREFGIWTGHGPRPPDEGILFRIESDSGVSHVLVTFDKTGRVKNVRLATNTEVSTVFEFGQSSAAYMLFNDLTASDSIFPRKGCEAVFREQFYTLPEVLPELVDAMHAQPAQDPVLVALIRKAYVDFSARAKAASGDEALIARKTLPSIGTSPAITVVYRDRDRALGTTTEFDVVRLDGGKRAYAMFYVDKDGKSGLGPMPFCVVGDTSCAQFYAWP